jgi:type IV secretory pathway VirB10-like protein
MAILRTKLQPTGQMQLSRTNLLLAGGVVLLLVAVLVLAQRAVPSVGSLLARKEPEPVRMVEPPDVLKPSARPYAQLMPKPEPPVAQPVVRQPLPPQPAPPAPAPPVVQAQQQPALPDFLTLWEKQQEAVAKQAQPPAPPVVQGPPAPKEEKKPERKPWLIKPTNMNLQDRKTKDGNAEAPGKGSPAGEAVDLIKHAKWARPSDVRKTLYMSQRLPGRLVDAMNSDQPGITRVSLTIPIFDKATGTYEILPKATIALIKQERKPVFGETVLEVKLLQLEPPQRRGEVIKFAGDLGDEHGNGLRGRVNNHWVKFGVAALINLGLNVGLNSIGGTPGRGQFFEDPVQQAGQDAARSASADVRKLTEAQLKVPPTITKAAGELVEIQLLENVTFVREPIVVR